MATSDLPATDAPAAHRIDRRANGSPPAAVSKKEKRYRLITSLLDSRLESRSRERDQPYREKLHQIQIDTNLIMRYNPHAFHAREELEIQLNSQNKAQPGQRSLTKLAGPAFSRFEEQIRDLMEERDYLITSSKWEYDKKVSEYSTTHAYKVETANREHRALAKTVSDRLVNNVTSKRFRLQKEKEALEIAEGSAYSLHPNQFSYANPASPGGTHGKRATRRRQEIDDLGGMESKKRKRNNEEDGSPAPQRRAVDTTNTTPMWQNDRLMNRKTTGPVYSIDKLFTDKELTMTYHTAAAAAHKYLLIHKPKLDGNGNIISSPEASDSGSNEQDEQDGSETVPSASMMERNVSHATRSARGGVSNPNFTDDKMIGLEALANFDFPGNFERMVTAEPKLPPILPTTYAKNGNRHNDVHQTGGLGLEDATCDWAIMGILKQYDNEHGVGSNLSSTDAGTRRLLEAVAAPAQERRFVSILQSEQRPMENDIRKRLGLPVADLRPPTPYAEGNKTPSKGKRTGTPRLSPAKPVAGSGLVPGSVPMSRQNSANGVSMSRSSSRKTRGN